MLTNLQDHLSHDRGDKEAIEDFQMSFGKGVKQHKRLMNVELKQLGGNEKVKLYLKKALEKAVDDFYYSVSDSLRSTGENIAGEGSDSKYRAQLLVETFLKDLSAEITEETEVQRDFDKLERSDPQWLKMASKYKKESHPETQDEKDEETMIANFKDNLDETSPVHLMQDQLQQAEQLLKLNDRLLSLKNDPDHKTRPRNEEAIYDKMDTMMKVGRINIWVCGCAAICCACVALLQDDSGRVCAAIT
jgi:hypothetical protein